MKREQVWKAVAVASGALAAASVRRAAVAAWRSGRHEDPPVHPGGDVRIGDALLWGVSVAVGVAVARVVAERLAASAWNAATGSPPPALDD